MNGKMLMLNDVEYVPFVAYVPITFTMLTN